MAIVKVKGRQTTSISREAEGADVYLRALRDGSMITSDWKQAAIMGGFGYIANVGALSTGEIGGGGGSILDIDTPELVISVPNGTSILPLRVGVHVQTGTPADAGEMEILVAVDQDAEWVPNGVGWDTEPIFNINTLCGKSSGCLARGAFTSTIDVPPVLDIELARKVVQFNIGTGTAAFAHGVILDLVYEPKNPPILNGPCMLIVYQGGSAATVGGFIDCSWLEFPESAFKL